MRILGVNSYALSISVAAIVLVACRGSQGPGAPPVGNAVMLETTRSKAAPPSGAIVGKYEGTSTYRGCIMPRRDGNFEYVGSGRMSFLRRSSESGQLTRHHAGKGAPCQKWGGVVTVTSSRDSKNATMARLYGGRYASPCGHKFVYLVNDGTGKFGGAYGRGTVMFRCSSSESGSIPYFDRWSGSLYWEVRSR